MSYLDEFGRSRPGSSTPPIGSPNFGYMDNIAQSYRSNQFRPPSPISQPQRNKSNDGQSLFKRHKVEFAPDEPITHLATGRGKVILASKDKKVMSIDTTSSKQTDCDVARCLGARLAQARVHRLFVDPTGKFTLISLVFASDNQPMENLLHVKQVQSLPRLKSHLITSVAWNHPKTNSAVNTGSSTSTGTILLGTSKGLVLQTEFTHSDETKFFPLGPGPRQYVKEVFDVGQDAGPITGIEYHQIPSVSSTEKSFVIIVCTNNRLYRMAGSVSATTDPPPLHLIFAQNSTNYKEVPGRFTNSKLDFFYPNANSPPTRFAWLTEPGVMTGELHTILSACKVSFESNEDINIIPYNAPRESPDELPLSSSTPSGASPLFSSMAAYYDKPISMVVTNFHVIVLFRHCIRAICILNDVTIYEEYFSTKYGNILGMCKDAIKNVIWVYCERAIFRYKISNENKNIWKIYLDQKRFDLAKRYSSGDENNYDRVICEEALHYFKLKDYEKSAEIFARSKKPFEDVSLMFMEVKSFQALKKYLMIRMERFDPNQMTQLTMTLAWLMEIIISSISVLKTKPATDRSLEELEELYSELDTLLENKQVVDCLAKHSKLFYGIIRNYSDWKTYILVAKLIHDYDKVIQCYFDRGEYDRALEIMRIVKRNELFYKYGHMLMKQKPKELVDALIEQPNISPSKLIPLLIQENPYFNKCNETIRYLEYCVKVRGTDNKVIHNYLFELYARYRSEDVLMDYLEQQIPTDGTQQYYLDLQLCLRLCTELKLTKTCVTLYSLMGLYDESLNLALSFDIELAKGIAKRADSDDHQKRLWLAIAEHVLTRDLDIKIATNLLKESRLLKIEDILPFFPDYTTIDYFKVAITQSLQDYKNQIELLKDGTYEVIADQIRSEIKAFRNRYSIIKLGQRCEICSKNLFTRTFYVFPCGHLFHSDCIIKELISIDPHYKDIGQKLKQLTLDGSNLATNNLNNRPMSHNRNQNFLVNSISSQNNRFNTNINLMNSVNYVTTLTNNVTSPPAIENKEKIVHDLDQIISSECIYCGSLLPSYIDRPPPRAIMESDE